MVAIVAQPDSYKRADQNSGADGAAQLHEFELVTRGRIWALACEAAVDKVAWLRGLRAACERNVGFEYVGDVSELYLDGDDGDDFTTAEEEEAGGSGRGSGGGTDSWQGALLQQTTRVLHQHRLHLRAFFRQIDVRASGSVRSEEFKVRGVVAGRIRRRCQRPFLLLLFAVAVRHECIFLTTFPLPRSRCRLQAGLRLMNVHCEGEQIGEAQIEGLVDFLDPLRSGIVGYDEFFEGLRVQTTIMSSTHSLS